jgi:xanthine dehydrogenase small subunit
MIHPIAFLLNELSVESDLPPATVVLDYLRRERGLTGTKEVCREGDCGACMVLLGEPPADDGAASVRYMPVNSCLLPLGALPGRHLVSIEGLNLPLPHPRGGGSLPLNPVQRHLVSQGAIQCGFCTPGFVVALSGFLLNAGELTVAQAVQAVAGNICRCTGYASIRRAIKGLLEEYARHCDGRPPAPGPARLDSLVGYGVLPPYFREIPDRLARLRRSGGLARPSDRDRPVWIAGGTDLFVQRPEELLGEAVAFVSRRTGIAGARMRSGYLELGAGTSMEELKRLPEVGRVLPQLLEALELVASTPIRERATIGGNIVNASPIGDLTIMLLALGARLGIRPAPPARGARGAGKVRELPLEELFQGYKRLALGEGEVLEWVAVPVADEATRGNCLFRFSFEKVCRRQHLDIASVNSAAWIAAEGGRVLSARLSAGGVAPVPLFLKRASAALRDREVSDEAVGEALALAQEEIAPISDVRGSADYKRLLLRQLLLAHFLKVFPGRLREELWV